ncbi:GNAT family N-acetyltransferase, partial [Candidatus Gracilibacteria bacterium]|nr:GNAT family N-acetyltransferase [Candidatus Gracilibacteria bacterium]
TPVAWGGQVWATPQHPYITHIHTLETHRRRGLALSIMHALLHDASTRGAQTSVLAATALGRSLYQRLGYQDVAHIRIWQSPPLESGVLCRACSPAGCSSSSSAPLLPPVAVRPPLLPQLLPQRRPRRRSLTNRQRRTIPSPLPLARAAKPSPKRHRACLSIISRR